MKNKNKYNLKNISGKVVYNINGCGRQTKETRKVQILYNDKVVKEVKTIDGLFQVVMEWLEEGEE